MSHLTYYNELEEDYDEHVHHQPVPYQEEEGEEDEEECPLCMEPFDATDKQFTPCQCSYKICLWCWHSLNDLHEGASSLSSSHNQRDRPPLKLSGKCPNCRRLYEYPSSKLLVNAEALQSSLDNKQNRIKAKKEAALRKKQAALEATRVSSQRTGFGEDSLATTRIIQRSMLYVTGLPIAVAQEDVLTSARYYGKFGRILKIALNRRQIGPPTRTYGSSAGSSSYSAHITFKRQSDCTTAIMCTNGTLLNNNLIKATNGTTKYCAAYLRGQLCSLNKCGYLHEPAKREDIITREQLIALDKKCETDNPAPFPLTTSLSEAIAACKAHLIANPQRALLNEELGLPDILETKPAPSPVPAPAPAVSAWGARANPSLRPFVSVLAQNSSSEPSAVPVSPKHKSAWPALTSSASVVTDPSKHNATASLTGSVSTSSPPHASDDPRWSSKADSSSHSRVPSSANHTSPVAAAPAVTIPVAAKKPVPNILGIDSYLAQLSLPLPLTKRDNVIAPQFDYDFLFHSRSDFASLFLGFSSNEPTWGWLHEHPCIQTTIQYRLVNSVVRPASPVSRFADIAAKHL